MSNPKLKQDERQALVAKLILAERLKPQNTMKRRKQLPVAKSMPRKQL